MYWHWPTTVLGYNQLAAVLFFQRHGMVQRDDGALGLGVGWRSRGYALQPESGRGHQGEQLAAMPGSQANELIRNACDHRQKHEPNAEPGPESGYRTALHHQDVHHDRDRHSRPQKAGAATRME